MHEGALRSPRGGKHARKDGAHTFPLSQIESWKAELAAMPPPDPRKRMIGKFAAVGLMAEELKLLVQRGYKTRELTELLKEKGLIVHVDTVRRVLRQSRGTQATAAGEGPTTKPLPGDAPRDAPIQMVPRASEYEAKIDTANGQDMRPTTSTAAVETKLRSETDDAPIGHRLASGSVPDHSEKLAAALPRSSDSAPIGRRSLPDHREEVRAGPSRPGGGTQNVPLREPGRPPIGRTADVRPIGGKASFVPRNDSDDI